MKELILKKDKSEPNIKNKIKKIIKKKMIMIIIMKEKLLI